MSSSSVALTDDPSNEKKGKFSFIQFHKSSIYELNDVQKAQIGIGEKQTEYKVSFSDNYFKNSHIKYATLLSMAMFLFKQPVSIEEIQRNVFSKAFPNLDFAGDLKDIEWTEASFEAFSSLYNTTVVIAMKQKNGLDFDYRFFYPSNDAVFSFGELPPLVIVQDKSSLGFLRISRPEPLKSHNAVTPDRLRALNNFLLEGLPKPLQNIFKKISVLAIPLRSKPATPIKFETFQLNPDSEEFKSYENFFSKLAFFYTVKGNDPIDTLSAALLLTSEKPLNRIAYSALGLRIKLDTYRGLATYVYPGFRYPDLKDLENFVALFNVSLVIKTKQGISTIPAKNPTQTIFLNYEDSGFQLSLPSKLSDASIYAYNAQFSSSEKKNTVYQTIIQKNLLRYLEASPAEITENFFEFKSSTSSHNDRHERLRNLSNVLKTKPPTSFQSKSSKKPLPASSSKVLLDDEEEEKEVNASNQDLTDDNFEAYAMLRNEEISIMPPDMISRSMRRFKLDPMKQGSTPLIDNFPLTKEADGSVVRQFNNNSLFVWRTQFDDNTFRKWPDFFTDSPLKFVLLNEPFFVETNTQQVNHISTLTVPSENDPFFRNMIRRLFSNNLSGDSTKLTICAEMSSINPPHVVKDPYSIPFENPLIDVDGYFRFFELMGTFLEDNGLNQHRYNLYHLFIMMFIDLNNSTFDHYRMTERILWFLYTFLLKENPHLQENNFSSAYYVGTGGFGSVFSVSLFSILLLSPCFKWQWKLSHLWIFSYLAKYPEECSIPGISIREIFKNALMKNVFSDPPTLSTSTLLTKPPSDFIASLNSTPDDVLLDTTLDSLMKWESGTDINSNQLPLYPIAFDKLFTQNNQDSNIPTLILEDIYFHIQIHSIIMTHPPETFKSVDNLLFSIQTIDGFPLSLYSIPGFDPTHNEDEKETGFLYGRQLQGEPVRVGALFVPEILEVYESQELDKPLPQKTSFVSEIMRQQLFRTYEFSSTLKVNAASVAGSKRTDFFALPESASVYQYDDENKLIWNTNVVINDNSESYTRWKSHFELWKKCMRFFPSSEREPSDFDLTSAEYKQSQRNYGSEKDTSFQKVRAEMIRLAEDLLTSVKSSPTGNATHDSKNKLTAVGSILRRALVVKTKWDNMISKINQAELTFNASYGTSSSIQAYFDETDFTSYRAKVQSLIDAFDIDSLIDPKSEMHAFIHASFDLNLPKLLTIPPYPITPISDVRPTENRTQPPFLQVLRSSLGLSIVSIEFIKRLYNTITPQKVEIFKRDLSIALSSLDRTLVQMLASPVFSQSVWAFPVSKYGFQKFIVDDVLYTRTQRDESQFSDRETGFIVKSMFLPHILCQEVIKESNEIAKLHEKVTHTDVKTITPLRNGAWRVVTPAFTSKLNRFLRVPSDQDLDYRFTLTNDFMRYYIKEAGNSYGFLEGVSVFYNNDPHHPIQSALRKFLEATIHSGKEVENKFVMQTDCLPVQRYPDTPFASFSLDDITTESFKQRWPDTFLTSHDHTVSAGIDVQFFVEYKIGSCFAKFPEIINEQERYTFFLQYPLVLEYLGMRDVTHLYPGQEINNMSIMFTFRVDIASKHILSYTPGHYNYKIVRYEHNKHREEANKPPSVVISPNNNAVIKRLNTFPTYVDSDINLIKTADIPYREIAFVQRLLCFTFWTGLLKDRKFIPNCLSYLSGTVYSTVYHDQESEVFDGYPVKVTHSSWNPRSEKLFSAIERPHDPSISKYSPEFNTLFTTSFLAMEFILGWPYAMGYHKAKSSGTSFGIIGTIPLVYNPISLHQSEKNMPYRFLDIYGYDHTQGQPPFSPSSPSSSSSASSSPTSPESPDFDSDIQFDFEDDFEDTSPKHHFSDNDQDDDVDNTMNDEDSNNQFNPLKELYQDTVSYLNTSSHATQSILYDDDDDILEIIDGGIEPVPVTPNMILLDDDPIGSRILAKIIEDTEEDSNDSQDDIVHTSPATALVESRKISNRATSTQDAEKARAKYLKQIIANIPDFASELYKYLFDFSYVDATSEANIESEHQLAIRRIDAFRTYFPEAIWYAEEMFSNNRLLDHQLIGKSKKTTYSFLQRETVVVNTEFMFKQKKFGTLYTDSKKINPATKKPFILFPSSPEFVESEIRTSIPASNLVTPLSSPMGAPIPQNYNFINRKLWLQDYKTDIIYVLKKMKNKSFTPKKVQKIASILKAALAIEFNDYGYLYPELKLICVVMSENLYILLTRILRFITDDRILDDIRKALWYEWISDGYSVVFLPMFQVLEEKLEDKEHSERVKYRATFFQASTSKKYIDEVTHAILVDIVAIKAQKQNAFSSLEGCSPSDSAFLVLPRFLWHRGSEELVVDMMIDEMKRVFGKNIMKNNSAGFIQQEVYFRYGEDLTKMRLRRSRSPAFNDTAEYDDDSLPLPPKNTCLFIHEPHFSDEINDFNEIRDSKVGVREHVESVYSSSVESLAKTYNSLVKKAKTKGVHVEELDINYILLLSLVATETNADILELYTHRQSLKMKLMRYSIDNFLVQYNPLLDHSENIQAHLEKYGELISSIVNDPQDVSSEKLDAVFTSLSFNSLQKHHSEDIPASTITEFNEATPHMRRIIFRKKLIELKRAELLEHYPDLPMLAAIDQLQHLPIDDANKEFFYLRYASFLDRFNIETTLPQDVPPSLILEDLKKRRKTLSISSLSRDIQDKLVELYDIDAFLDKTDTNETPLSDDDLYETNLFEYLELLESTMEELNLTSKYEEKPADSQEFKQNPLLENRLRIALFKYALLQHLYNKAFSKETAITETFQNKKILSDIFVEDRRSYGIILTLIDAVMNSLGVDISMSTNPENPFSFKNLDMTQVEFDTFVGWTILNPTLLFQKFVTPNTIEAIKTYYLKSLESEDLNAVQSPSIPLVQQLWDTHFVRKQIPHFDFADLSSYRRIITTKIATILIDAMLEQLVYETAPDIFVERLYNIFSGNWDLATVLDIFQTKNLLTPPEEIKLRQTSINGEKKKDSEITSRTKSYFQSNLNESSQFTSEFPNEIEVLFYSPLRLFNDTKIARAFLDYYAQRISLTNLVSQIADYLQIQQPRQYTDIGELIRSLVAMAKRRFLSSNPWINESPAEFMNYLTRVKNHTFSRPERVFIQYLWTFKKPKELPDILKFVAKIRTCAWKSLMTIHDFKAALQLNAKINPNVTVNITVRILQGLQSQPVHKPLKYNTDLIDTPDSAFLICALLMKIPVEICHLYINIDRRVILYILMMIRFSTLAAQETPVPLSYEQQMKNALSSVFSTMKELAVQHREAISLLSNPVLLLDAESSSSQKQFTLQPQQDDTSLDQTPPVFNPEILSAYVDSNRMFKTNYIQNVQNYKVAENAPSSNLLSKKKRFSVISKINDKLSTMYKSSMDFFIQQNRFSRLNLEIPSNYSHSPNLSDNETLYKAIAFLKVSPLEADPHLISKARIISWLVGNLDTPINHTTAITFRDLIQLPLEFKDNSISEIERITLYLNSSSAWNDIVILFAAAHAYDTSILIVTTLENPHHWQTLFTPSLDLIDQTPIRILSVNMLYYFPLISKGNQFPSLSIPFSSSSF